MSSDGNWYVRFWSASNPAVGVFPDAWKQLNDVFDAMYDGGAFFDHHLPKDRGPFLGIGVGYGGFELVLASRGWTGLGIDNNRDALAMAGQNAALLAGNRLVAAYADLADPAHFPGFFAGRGVSACVSFGVMEHFAPDTIPAMIDRQFAVAPRVICMVPVSTPGTLAFFDAPGPGEHVEEKSGIYRVLQPAEWWEREVFGDRHVVAVDHSTNPNAGIDMTTFVVDQ